MNHGALLEILKPSFGVIGTVIRWFESYLQYLKIGDSHTSKLKTGVLQGSVLGALLSPIYMHSLGEYIREHNVQIYAYADTLIY